MYEIAINLRRKEGILKFYPPSTPIGQLKGHSLHLRNLTKSGNTVVIFFYRGKYL